MMTRRELLAFAAGSLSASCGYALAGRGDFLPAYIQTVAVPVFLNRTPFAAVEQLLTEKVRVEFQSRGRYTVKPTEDGADGVVRGEIISITAAPVSFTNSQLAQRYRFTVTVSVKFDDLRQKKTLWENSALSFSDEYELASRNPAALGAANFMDQERVTVERIATDFARNVVQAILEAF